ncbi:hypothetical protein PIROE2DRAFT_58519 [Piromyces sp. E2]|nr:hypothetical protein PIROE2DRAFT_58519 [Piromyces sp. E2]|eukprot:OUM67834.1 hypothetical protein PIROE2DRAFT_58519 [Piromyces sp. E2]
MSSPTLIPRTTRIIDSIITKYKEFFVVYQKAFHETDPRIAEIFSSSSYVPEFSSFVKVDQKVVSYGGIRKKSLRIFNLSEKVPFIFGIVTLPEERKKGYASENLKALLNKTYHANYNIIMIASNPHDEHLIRFYEKFGFNKFSYQKRIPFENLFKKGFDIRLGCMDDCEEICKIFNKYIENYKLSLERDLEFTRNKVREVLADDYGKLFFLSKNNENYGYFLYRKGEIDESLILLEGEPNEDLAIIENTFTTKGFKDVFEGLLNSKYAECTVSAAECTPESDAFTLFRIINPMNFMKKYINYIYFDDTETFNKNIIVEDPLIKDCSFNINKNGKDIKVSEKLDSDAITIKITISDLTKKILNNFLNNNTEERFTIKNKFFCCESW